MKTNYLVHLKPSSYMNNCYILYNGSINFSLLNFMYLPFKSFPMCFPPNRKGQPTSWLSFFHCLIIQLWFFHGSIIIYFWLQFGSNHLSNYTKRHQNLSNSSYPGNSMNPLKPAISVCPLPLIRRILINIIIHPIGIQRKAWNPWNI